MKSMSRRHLCGWILAGGLLAVSSSHASTEPAWPSKSIQLIVPFAPGASNDVIARALAVPLAKELGQPVVVENRPGAGGAVGAARSEEHTSELQSLMRISYAVFCLKKKTKQKMISHK